MIRVLQAQESLRRVTVIAAGNGLIKKGERDRILNEWRRDARRGQQTKKGKGPTTLDTLIGNGIGLKFVRKGEHSE